jgi:hypothetical protein
MPTNNIKKKHATVAGRNQNTNPPKNRTNCGATMFEAC